MSEEHGDPHPLASIPPKKASWNLPEAFKGNADGLIDEDRTYYDTAEVMRQLGLVK
jgi:hypothetical protein